MELNNEEKAILKILKDYNKEYNANNLSKSLGLTSMGSLKLLRRLEKQNVVKIRKVSNINFYNLNFEDQYVKDYVSLILRKEADNSSAFVKRWVNEIRKIRLAETAVIFGSVLSKGKNAKDVDVLFVVKNNKFGGLKKELSKLNDISEKKIHAVYQTKGDLFKNIEGKDKVVLEILKGVVVLGEKNFVDLLGRGSAQCIFRRREYLSEVQNCGRRGLK